MSFEISRATQSLLNMYVPEIPRALQSRRLERSARNRILAGVIGGLGEYLNVDANLLRMVAVVLLIVFPPLMVILYLAAVLLLPKAGDEKPPIASLELERHGALLVGLTLLILGAALLGSTALSPVFFISPLDDLRVLSAIVTALLALLLIVIGLALAMPSLRKI